MDHKDNKTSHVVPDFVIAGAMKSGTTTLHAMLAEHPDVFMADNELFFYDMDDLAQHPDFFEFKNNQWYYPHFDDDSEGFLTWYKEQFKACEAYQLKGEDSTTYLVSELALKRLKAANPNVKLIIMLRHPTKRTYSHYWHMVRAGRAIYTFEDTLRFQPGLLLQRSDYANQLTTVFKHFDRSAVKVVLFEEFIQEPKKVLHSVCEFLGVDRALITPEVFRKHSNKGQVPFMYRLHLLKCRLFREASSKTYRNHFSRDIVSKASFLERVYRKLNPMLNQKPPRMSASTEAMLNQYFMKTQAELDDILQRPVFKSWFGEK